METPTAGSGTATGPSPSIFLRNLALGGLFEVFLVSAVASVLMIRGALALSGFPRIGGGGLHIAHLLWGGAFMLAGLLLLLGFIGRAILYVGAFLGGVGFGTFIDELGKFITSDNDYFFRPAVAIVYVVFVTLFLIFRALESRRRFSDRELLANAFDAAREATLYHRRPGHSREVLRYLREHGGDDRLLGELRDVLGIAGTEPPLAPGWLLSARRAVLRRYVELVESRRLNRSVLVLFALYGIFIVAAVGIAALGAGSGSLTGDIDRVSAAHLGIFLADGVSLALLVVGALSLGRSRPAAFHWFERAVLVDLLLAQVFYLYVEQFGALVAVALDVVVLLVLKGLIRVERHAEHHPERHPSAAAASAERAR